MSLTRPRAGLPSRARSLAPPYLPLRPLLPSPNPPASQDGILFRRTESTVVAGTAGNSDTAGRAAISHRPESRPPALRPWARLVTGRR